MKCPSCGCLNKKEGKCEYCEYQMTPEVEEEVYRIPKVSEKYKKRNKLKMEAYAEVDKKEIRWCESCGCTDKPLSRSHILPVGMYPKFEADPCNILIECYGSTDSCHFIWENGTIEQKIKLETWEHKVNYILKKAPSYLNLLMKNHQNTV